MDTLALSNLENNLLAVSDVVNAHGPNLLTKIGAYCLPTRLIKILGLRHNIYTCKNWVYSTTMPSERSKCQQQHDRLQAWRYRHKPLPPPSGITVTQWSLQLQLTKLIKLQCTSSGPYDPRKISDRLAHYSFEACHTYSIQLKILSTTLWIPTTLCSAHLHQWHLALKRVRRDTICATLK